MKRKTPSQVTTAILTLITIFAWVSFEIYRSFTTKTPPQVPDEIIRPLDPTLDTKTLDELGQRLSINNLQITATSPLPSAQPTSSPTPAASPIATQSPTLTPTP